MKKLNFLKICIIILYYTVCVYSQSIENIEVKQDGRKVGIAYDLIGVDTSKLFYISLELSSNGGNTFSDIPRSLGGDFMGVKGGIGKKITWDVLRDVGALKGDNFVMKIIADETNPYSQIVKTGGISPWLWIGGGVAVVGGGAAVLLLKKSNKTQEIPDLPGPDKISWPK
jgi:hypothetical protein